MGLIDFKQVCLILCPHVKKTHKFWEGKKSIVELKSAGSKQWRQMEWIGWYFEFLCNKHLSEKMTMPSPKKYGNVSFDGFLEFPWDFKSHAKNSGNTVVINDSEATSRAIEEFGCVGVILAEGNVEYDNESRDFKKWHDELKGGISNYEKKRIQRNVFSRIRKISMKIEKIYFIKIDDETLIKCGNFQENFRNSNGNPRRKKVLLDLQEIKEKIAYTIVYN